MLLNRQLWFKISLKSLNGKMFLMSLKSGLSFAYVFVEDRPSINHIQTITYEKHITNGI